MVPGIEGKNLHNIKIQGEASSTEVETTASYPADLAKITNEEQYSNNRFSMQMKQLYVEKKIPSRTFIAREEKSMPGFKGYTHTLVRG